MKKRIALFLVLAMSITSLILVESNAYAGKTAKDKLNDINNRLNQVRNSIRIDKAKDKKLSNEICSIERKIGYTQNEIYSIANNIKDTEERIISSEKNIVKMEEEIKNQDDGLKKRLRAMYKNGSVKFIEVLLGSESVTDFMTNMDMVERIYAKDQDVLKSLKIQKDIIEAEKVYLEDLKIKLQQAKEQQARKQEELKLDIATVKDKKAKLQSDIKTLEAKRQEFVKEANRLSQEIYKSQSKGTQYTGGVMTWPVPSSKRITSPFGYRTLYGRKDFHRGTDIACKTGSDILAANDGIVLKARYSRSYGYYVAIDHGGGIVTLYAHNSVLLVKTGQAVTRGQTIAKAGSTGNSTGPHCHFEVMVNRKLQDPMKGWISK